MKQTFICLLIGALALHHVESAPDFGDVFQNIDQLGQHIRDEFVGELRKLAKSQADAPNELEQIFRDQAAEVLKNIDARQSKNQNGFGDLSDSVNRFQAILKTFTSTLGDEAKNQQSAIKQALLTRAKSTLEGLLERSKSLSRSTNDVKTTVLNGIERSQKRIEDKWTSYANSELQQVASQTGNDPTKVAQANAFLKEVLQTYEGELEECAAKVQNSVISYQDKVDTAVQEGQAILEELLSSIQTCLNNDNTVQSNNECRTSIRNNLEQLSDAPAEISKLAAEGASFLLIRFESSRCVASSLIKFELEKIPINVTIQKIIDGTYDPSSADTLPSDDTVNDIINEIAATTEPPADQAA